MKAPVTDMLAALSRGEAEPAVRGAEGFDAALRAVRDSHVVVGPVGRGEDRSPVRAARSREERPRHEARRDGAGVESARQGPPVREDAGASGADRPRRPVRGGARLKVEADGARPEAAALAGAVMSSGAAPSPSGAAPPAGLSPGALPGAVAPGWSSGMGALEGALLGLGARALAAGAAPGVRVHAAFSAGGVSTTSASAAPHPELAGRVGSAVVTPARAAGVAWTGEVAERLLEAVADTAIQHGEAGLRALVGAQEGGGAPGAGVGVAGGGGPRPPQEEVAVAIEAVLAGDAGAGGASAGGQDASEGVPWIADPLLRAEARVRAGAGPAPLAVPGEVPEVPEAAVRLPDRLQLGVVDRGGAWHADIERHVLPTGVQGLDVLLRGDAAFVAELRGAQGEMRRALELQDSRLLSFDVRADAGAGRERESHDPRGDGREAAPVAGRRGRGTTRPEATSAVPRAGRVDRLA